MAARMPNIYFDEVQDKWLVHAEKRAATLDKQNVGWSFKSCQSDLQDKRWLIRCILLKVKRKLLGMLIQIACSQCKVI